MRKLPAILSAALVLAACNGGQTASDRHPYLLGALPSDALEVAVSDRCSSLLEAALDSTDILRSIDYGKAASADAALAKCSVGTIKPVLAIDAGPASATDTSAAVKSILAQSDSLKLQSSLTTLGKRRILVLTPSESILGSVQRHIDTGTSVLDAPGFDNVLKSLGIGTDAIIYRNRAASKLIPGKFLANILKPSDLSSFLAGYAEWTIVPMDTDDFIGPIPCCGDSPKWFCNIFAQLPEGGSRLQAPDTLDLAVTVCTPDIKAFRAARESYIDAHSKLQKYKNTVASLRSSGYGPLEWEKASGVKEIARVFWEGRSVVLVRADRKAKTPKPGFLSILYGSFFEPEEIESARQGDWMILGTREAVDAYTSEELVLRPLKQAHYAVYLPKTIILD